MKVAEFVAGDWIDRLARALPCLAELQERYLQGYRELTPRMYGAFGGRDGDRPAFPLDDLLTLYAEARHSNLIGEQEHYEPLLAVLDPVRYILHSHPSLAAVVGRIIGKDDFWLQILNSGSATSPTDLIAGLMARAAELPGDGFREAATELNAFLGPIGQGESASVLGNLDVGCDAVLFWGLTLKERIEIADDMALLPFEQARAFVNENLVEELAPPGAGFHRWRSVGAVVRPFRWKPEFRRTGDLRDSNLVPPRPFFQKARILLELLAVMHAAPVLHLATLAHCIHRSAGRLLGLADHRGSLYRGRSAQEFDGFDPCPELVPEALAEAKEAFEGREGERYQLMAPIVGRLAEALARDGQFASEDKILDVAMALERMYELDQGEIVFKLKTRAACFLESDPEARS